jgi:hypothetical protein
MLDIMAVVALVALGAATAALIWAIAKIEREGNSGTQWQPGTRPHRWRF